MLKKIEKVKIDAAGSADWVVRLADCLDALRGENFYPRLQFALQALADFDCSVAYAYFRNERPICLAHTFRSKQRIVLVDEYLKGAYLLDPFFKICSQKIDPGLYRIGDIAPDRFYQSEYYRSYYHRTGIAEEICYTFYLDDDVAIVISLMCEGEGSRFSARQFRLLEKVAPIVTSLGTRHWLDVPARLRVETTTPETETQNTTIENRVRELFQNRLTPREIQVVAQVLEGHSSESIGNNLGITVGTVRIHRRNIYAKLKISSQQQLFSLFFNPFTKG